MIRISGCIRMKNWTKNSTDFPQIMNTKEIRQKIRRQKISDNIKVFS